MESSASAVTLCCLMWAHPGKAAALNDYEDRVLALFPDHGARVISRVQSDGSEGAPAEVCVLQFPSQEAMDDFVIDPRRLAMSGERDEVIARTELFPVKPV